MRRFVAFLVVLAAAFGGLAVSADASPADAASTKVPGCKGAFEAGAIYVTFVPEAGGVARAVALNGPKVKGTVAPGYSLTSNDPVRVLLGNTNPNPAVPIRKALADLRKQKQVVKQAKSICLEDPQQQVCTTGHHKAAGGYFESTFCLDNQYITNWTKGARCITHAGDEVEGSYTWDGNGTQNDYTLTLHIACPFGLESHRHYREGAFSSSTWCNANFCTPSNTGGELQDGPAPQRPPDPTQGWLGWQNRGGLASTTPIVTNHNGSDVTLLSVSVEGWLYSSYTTDGGATWSADYRHGTSGKFSCTQGRSGASAEADRLDVYTRECDSGNRSVWHRSNRGTGNNWSTWKQLPYSCAASDVAATSVDGGRSRDVYFVGCAPHFTGQIVHYWTVDDGTTWNSEVLGASLGVACVQGRPRPALEGPRVHVFFNTCFGPLQLTWDGSWRSARAPASAGGNRCLMGEPVVAVPSEGRISLYGYECPAAGQPADQSATVLYSAYQNGAWSGWRPVASGCFKGTNPGYTSNRSMVVTANCDQSVTLHMTDTGGWQNVGGCTHEAPHARTFAGTTFVTMISCNRNVHVGRWR